MDESRLSVAHHVLAGGALTGDEVPVKVVLELEIFEESLRKGTIFLALMTKGNEEICPRTKLEGLEHVRIVHFSTCAANRFDVAVRFALLESDEPVLFSQPFQLGAPPTPNEIAAAMKLLHAEKKVKPIVPPPPSSSSFLDRKSPTSSPRGRASEGKNKSASNSPRGKESTTPEVSPRSAWVAARPVSPTPGSPRSPRLPSPRVRSISSADQVPNGRPSSFNQSSKRPIAGQAVIALCKTDNEVILMEGIFFGLFTVFFQVAQGRRLFCSWRGFCECLV